MIEVLEFIFQNPWHYFGFIILWWCIIGSIRIEHTAYTKEDKSHGKGTDKLEEES